MTPYLEFEGRNIEKAIQKACDKLKISREELKYKVISYGSTGMFGVVGSKKAKISVTLQEKKEKIEFTKKEDDQLVEKKGNMDQSKESNDYLLTDQLVGAGENILRQIVNLITTDATITTEQSSKKILYRVNGGNSAVLIGKHGQTLEAIQYIIEKCVNKKSQDRIRVQVDVNGYLQKRKSNLESLAVRLAEKSKNNGKPITVGQMNAYERRIVHMALKDDIDVRTQSMGNGSIRKLVIFPKRNNRSASE
ncbi:MAG: Jag N-terminal domain-containing protein [Desulfobacterales bacterium]|nr:Jag N-terminal domain-containing protein [Desulfobacterales bacterium]